jgi:hypothetical protein
MSILGIGDKVKFRKVVRIGTLQTHGGGHVSIYFKIVIRDRGKGDELSITGVVGPSVGGNAYGGSGQIDMEFDHRDKSQNDSRTPSESLIKPADINFARGWNASKLYDLLDIWHNWHLNDMRPECEHQRALGWTWVTHPSAKCPTCGYKLGSAWLHEDLPADVVKFLHGLPDTDRDPAWV